MMTASHRTFIEAFQSNAAFGAPESHVELGRPLRSRPAPCRRPGVAPIVSAPRGAVL